VVVVTENTYLGLVVSVVVVVEIQILMLGQLAVLIEVVEAEELPMVDPE
jgi:hypothetical protein